MAQKKRQHGPQKLGKDYLTVGLDPDIKREIDEIAKNTNEDKSVIVRQLIRKGLGMATVMGGEA